MDAERVDLAGLESDAESLAGGGRTVVHVARGGKLWGLIAIADAARRCSSSLSSQAGRSHFGDRDEEEALQG